MAELSIFKLNESTDELTVRIEVHDERKLLARRIDAERFCAEDEDAWKILEVGAPLPSVQGGET